MKADLLLHCGAHAVPRPVLDNIATPRPTATWQPIPHRELLEHVVHRLPTYGLDVVNEAHAVTHDGMRYFGLLEIQTGHSTGEQAWVMGVRNSHDKMFPAGLVAGSQVLVCDNLCFFGTFTLSRKHTVHLCRDLPGLVDGTLAALVASWHTQEARTVAYRERRLTDKAAHDLLIRALDADACTSRQIPAILHEWREPSHEEFRPRNLWSFVNAGTEVLKGSSLPLLADRSERLHRVCDAAVGLN